MDKELFSKKFEVETKKFFFDLKENPKGKFLKISEISGGRRDSIVIPETGIDIFISNLQIVKSEISRR